MVAKPPSFSGQPSWRAPSIGITTRSICVTPIRTHEGWDAERVLSPTEDIAALRKAAELALPAPNNAKRFKIDRLKIRKDGDLDRAIDLSDEIDIFAGLWVGDAFHDADAEEVPPFPRFAMPSVRC